MAINMSKLLCICAGCGADWVSWVCPDCGGLQMARASATSMRYIRDIYAQRIADAKLRSQYDVDETNRLLFGDPTE